MKTLHGARAKLTALARPISFYMTFALFIIIPAVFYGTKNFGNELQCRHHASDLVKNFILGLCVALMALTFSITLLSWAKAKKKVLGLE